MIDILLVIYLVFLGLMLGFAITCDARRRARYRANAILQPRLMDQES